MDSEKRHFLPKRMGVTVAFEPSRQGGRELGPSVDGDGQAQGAPSRLEGGRRLRLGGPRVSAEPRSRRPRDPGWCTELRRGSGVCFVAPRAWRARQRLLTTAV